MSRRRVRRQQPDWTVTFDTDREPSAWLREAAAARLRAIGSDKQIRDIAPLFETIICPISNPSAPGSREDYSCDRCGRYCGEPDDGFRLFSVHCEAQRSDLPDVLLAGGLCDACAARENLEPNPEQGRQS